MLRRGFRFMARTSNWHSPMFAQALDRPPLPQANSANLGRPDEWLQTMASEIRSRTFDADIPKVCEHYPVVTARLAAEPPEDALLNLWPRK